MTSQSEVVRGIKDYQKILWRHLWTTPWWKKISSPFLTVVLASQKRIISVNVMILVGLFHGIVVVVVDGRGGGGAAGGDGKRLWTFSFLRSFSGRNGLWWGRRRTFESQFGTCNFPVAKIEKCFQNFDSVRLYWGILNALKLPPLQATFLQKIVSNYVKCLFLTAVGCIWEYWTPLTNLLTPHKNMPSISN